MTIPAWMKEVNAEPCPSGTVSTARKSFLRKTSDSIFGFFEGTLATEGYARRKGLLQSLDPRAKLIAALALVVAVTMVGNLPLLICLYLLLMILAYASKIDPGYYTKVVWAFVPIFSGVIVLPLIFNVFMAGDPLLHIFSSGGFTLYVTKQGLLFAVSFVARVITCAAAIVLLVLTTPQETLFKAFRSLGVPKIYVLTLDMAYRYIFLFMDIVRDIMTAKKSRTIRSDGMLAEQRWMAGRIGYMLLRTLDMSDKVHKAMISRGFTGDVKVMDTLRMRSRDYLVLVIGLSISVLLILYSQNLIRV